MHINSLIPGRFEWNWVFWEKGILKVFWEKINPVIFVSSSSMTPSPGSGYDVIMQMLWMPLCLPIWLCPTSVVPFPTTTRYEVKSWSQPISSPTANPSSSPSEETSTEETTAMWDHDTTVDNISLNESRADNNTIHNVTSPQDVSTGAPDMGSHPAGQFHGLSVFRMPLMRSDNDNEITTESVVTTSKTFAVTDDAAQNPPRQNLTPPGESASQRVAVAAVLSVLMVILALGMFVMVIWRSRSYYNEPQNILRLHDFRKFQR